jgi:hypothetical protein
VFHPNPVQETGNTGLADNADATGAALDAARSDVTLTNLNASTFLVGDFADLSAPGVAGCTLPYAPPAANEPTRSYDYDRSDDRFEEASAYHSITEMQKLIQALGFADVNNRSIPVDVHCIAGDNSFYSSGDEALHFGDGGVDDAEDGDIVIHEYGHSVHDDQVPGWGPAENTEQRAMGEGFGDLLAAMFYIGTGNPAYEASDRKYCVGDWDAVSYNPVSNGPGGGCLRWVNGRSQDSGADIGTYTGTPVQEHGDGRFWSAAMTCVFEGMGANLTARDNLLRLVLASHESLTPDSSNAAFENQIASMLNADTNMFAGANRALIQSCAVGRGLVVAPSAPSITGTTPSSGADDHTPQVFGTVPATGTPNEVKVFTNNNCLGAPAATGTVADFSGAGITVTVPENATTSLSSKASGLGGDSPCSNFVDYTEVTPAGNPPSADTVAPDTRIDLGPRKKTTRKRARFAFSATEAGSTFACSLNGKSFAPCSSPLTVKAKSGKNRFEVRATDAAGNADSTPATHSWKLKRRR